MKKGFVTIIVSAVATLVTACGTDSYIGPQGGPHTLNTVEQGDRVLGEKDMRGRSFPSKTTTNDTNESRVSAADHDSRAMTFSTAPFNQRLAFNLARAADDIPGVAGATAVVHGNDVIVGIHNRIRISDTRQREIVEQRVREAVRSLAPGKNIHITSKNSLYSRIQRMNDSLESGVTASGTSPRTTNTTDSFAALYRDVANDQRPTTR